MNIVVNAIERGFKQSFRYIVTPNVDHLVRLHNTTHDHNLWRAYRDADLCLCDSRIVSRLARLCGVKLAVIPGSDLTQFIFESGILKPGTKVTVIGGDARLIEFLGANCSEIHISHHQAPMDLAGNALARSAAATFAARERADITFLAVGSPQQELIAQEMKSIPGATGVALCIGASLDFLSGRVRRAPLLLQRLGLEWLFRLITEPRRMWRRYLIRGPRIFWLALRWWVRRERDEDSRSGIGPGSADRRGSLSAAIGGAIILAAALAVFALDVASGDSETSVDGGSPSLTAQGLGLPPLPPPDLLKPLSAQEAMRKNAERSFFGGPLVSAKPFIVTGNSASQARALECLAQAIYYEAASEGEDGGRAVAQVVLNRVRRPGYPNSICGVVYEGSQRMTGCQFSFTCDGSLARFPVPRLWSQAWRIAQEALSGRVYPKVGLSTNYHADYVLPYWADSLQKSAQIGRHIFYQLPGKLSAPAAFVQRYSAAEPISASSGGLAVIKDAVEHTDSKLAPSEVPIENVLIEGSKLPGPVNPPLWADQMGGQLILGPTTETSSKAQKSRQQNRCAKGADRIERMLPNELKAGATEDAC